ncbi:MAG: hypothetical protein CM1200mP18_07100 [Gammaproteobacteria bacterium]|nr:MAG: hypothetical protein CM1200mP18_07100 [Gammaproteobacteria bacterium]
MDEKLILYLRDYCGYCAMVQDVISELQWMLKNAILGERLWQNELIAGQGSATAPVCVATAQGDSWLPESDTIIRYLIQTYD